jgi:hypothetical protein
MLKGSIRYKYLLNMIVNVSSKKEDYAARNVSRVTLDMLEFQVSKNTGI